MLLPTLLLAVACEKDSPAIDDSQIISFADENVKKVCVKNWDTNGDGNLSVDEAAAVKDIELAFYDNPSIKTFDEFKFFTGLTFISYDAFFECSNLKSITLPTTIKEIHDSAFDGCSSLYSITLPESVTHISIYAFARCAAITEITIPKNTIEIGDYAFSSCLSLRKITCKPTTPPSTCEDAFMYIHPNFKIFVPTAAYNDYITAEGWATYADHIYDSEGNQGQQGSTEVKVKTITITPSEVEIQVKKSIQFEAIVLPENATDKSLFWRSDNHDVATVMDGFVVGHEPGVATIIAEAQDGSGVIGTATIVVVERGFRIGQLYQNNGIEGIVFKVSDDKKEASILSLDQLYDVDATTALQWAIAYGEGWNLPSIADLQAIYDNIEPINAALAKISDAKLIDTEYYSEYVSREWDDDEFANTFSMKYGKSSWNDCFGLYTAIAMHQVHV